MINLAGRKECDEFIAEELRVCRISAVRTQVASREVPASIVGELGPFSFVRAWKYWIVEGPVPPDMAAELYADPLGQRDVRVNGHCGCPPPAVGETVYVYHIESEAGLRIFADAAHRRGLGSALEKVK